MSRTLVGIASLVIFSASCFSPAIVRGEDERNTVIEQRTDFLHNRISALLAELREDGNAGEKLAALESEINALEAVSSDSSVAAYNQKNASSTRSKDFDYEAAYKNCEGLENADLVEALHKLVDNHVALDYRGARYEMFAHVDNCDGWVECVYTGRKLQTDKIPNGSNMNCEHTWPQSQGAVGVAKTDIHHLFPADSKSNSVRGHLAFGNVDVANWSQGGSSRGSARGDDVFEVRHENRGNTARAKFYFAVRYGKRIDAEEEATLRAWHAEDPVDEGELARNTAVQNIQKNRNPFVDHPEFVNRISDF